MNSITYAKKTLAPSKIVCVGRNYVEHVTELGNELPDDMVLFCKPNSAISSSLRATHLGEQLHYEAEICFLVEDRRFVAVGVGLDLTKRELQSRLKSKGLPWERAKAFDGSAVLGSFVPFTQSEAELTITLSINGSVRQQGSTAQMLYRPAEILTEIQSFMTLEDGDVVMTGTPAGVGPIVVNDRFHGIVGCGETELTASSWQAVA